MPDHCAADYTPMMPRQLEEQQGEAGHGCSEEPEEAGVCTPRLSYCRKKSSLEIDPDKNARIAASKAISILMKMETDGYCGVEKGSVYGAAVAIPQIARSSGWSKTLLGLTVRVYVFLLVNFLLQGFLICVINEEAIIMNAYSGQMHLCNFGASLESCPGDPSCRGPGGTEITASRLYSYSLWSTRTFVRDSLKQLFPEKTEEIQQTVDPGEYGMENYYCRLVCCFLFMMAVVDDLRATVELGYLLLAIPSENGHWIQYETPEWAEKEQAKLVHGWGELDLVKFQIRGMPRQWKVVNIMFIFIPKLVLWYSVTSSGFCFLMETAGIVDLVVNAMALTFVLGIDEMIIERFGTVTTLHMMEKLEAWPLFDTSREETETVEQAYERQDSEDSKPMLSDFSLCIILVPKRLFLVILLMVIFVCKYYYTNCERTEDGTWVSQDMYMPKRVAWDPMSLWNIRKNLESVPYWTMPNVHDEG